MLTLTVPIARAVDPPLLKKVAFHLRLSERTTEGDKFLRSYNPDEYAPYLLGLSLRMPSWVMRRVESIQLIDDTSQRHRVSMDFFLREEETVGQEYVDLIVAGLLPAVIIPVAFLAKKPLAEFNLTGHDGKPLSLLPQAEATDLAVAMLLDWDNSRVSTPQSLPESCEA